MEFLTDGTFQALSIFFIGYVIYETPSNILLRRLSPKWYIPLLTVIWGVICALASKVQNASGLLAVRFFLGIAEAGFLPAIIFWGAFLPCIWRFVRFSPTD